MPAGSRNDGGVMAPVLPRTPFADDLNRAIRQRLDELDVVMRVVWRRKNFAHRLRSRGRNQFPLLQKQKIAEQLSDGCGMGIVAERIADALTPFAVMLADPDSASVVWVVEMIGVQHRLDLL